MISNRTYNFDFTRNYKDVNGNQYFPAQGKMQPKFTGCIFLASIIKVFRFMTLH